MTITPEKLADIRRRMNSIGEHVTEAELDAVFWMAREYALDLDERACRAFDAGVAMLVRGAIGDKSHAT